MKMQLVLDSHPKNIAKIEPFIHEVTKHCRCSLDEGHFGNILVAVTEAVNNAIIHGNRAKESKKVTIHTQMRSGRLHFLIEDEGVGFDPKTIPDPTAPENILKPGGRGVFLMRELADELHFLEQGRKVEIQFQI